ncbi:MAG: PulJ/GspJ family protein [Dehalococcoidia bacterium]
MGIRLIHKGQRGFTLIEMLVVITITGLIAAGLTGTIMQVLTMTHGTSNRMTAVRQVQQAGFWVSPDVQMAQNVTPGGSSGFPLTLNWTDPGTGSHHMVVYTLQYVPSRDVTVLQRSHYMGTNSTPDSTFIVAEYVNSDLTSFSPTTPCFFPNCGDFTFTVTATVGSQTETKVYKVTPRPGT